jgi:hypothetical protein
MALPRLIGKQHQYMGAMTLGYARYLPSPG